MPDSPEKLSIEKTRDGSHTLYSNRFNQHYHNPNGAVAESEYVFFEQSGLMDILHKADLITILEIGFGTGLNLLLLIDKYLTRGSTAHIQFHSIEAYPISPETAASINYADYLQHPEIATRLPDIFHQMEPGFNHFNLFNNIEFTLFYGLFEEYEPDSDTRYDFIFHDAFSPDVNAELWSGEVFKKLLRWSNPVARMTTYSAASRIKGAMAWAGWHVAEAPGALGKREMTVSSPTTEPLGHLKRVNEEHLARRYEESDF